MPSKKQDLPQRLSEYLLRKAEPFEFYPKRIYGLDPDVRRVFLDLSRELVEWRKAFQPKGDGRRLDFFAQPVMLDQFYSKELLAAVPGFVERTQELRALTFTGVADPESLAYLREAATCYIHGLFQATAALARGAMELRLRARLSLLAGREVVKGLDLKELLERFGDRVLGKRGMKLAAVVRITGNQVLHEQAIGSKKALEVLEGARTVILELK
jgi:hypothetical protein